MFGNIAQALQQIKSDVGKALEAVQIVQVCAALGHRWRERELDPVSAHSASRTLVRSIAYQTAAFEGHAYLRQCNAEDGVSAATLVELFRPVRGVMSRFDHSCESGKELRSFSPASRTLARWETTMPAARCRKVFSIYTSIILAQHSFFGASATLSITASA